MTADLLSARGPERRDCLTFHITALVNQRLAWNNDAKLGDSTPAGTRDRLGETP
jgi:hypothetical protein